MATAIWTSSRARSCLPMRKSARRPAVVWLEQTRPGVFERHTLKAGLPAHATLDTGDLDNDGDVDVVVGNFSLDGHCRA